MFTSRTFSKPGEDRHHLAHERTVEASQHGTLVLVGQLGRVPDVHEERRAVGVEAVVEGEVIPRREAVHLLIVKVGLIQDRPDSCRALHMVVDLVFAFHPYLPPKVDDQRCSCEQRP